MHVAQFSGGGGNQVLKNKMSSQTVPGSLDRSQLGTQPELCDAPDASANVKQ